MILGKGGRLGSTRTLKNERTSQSVFVLTKKIE